MQKPHPRRRGSAAISALFWLMGLAIFVAPFLLPRDLPDWRAADPGRKTAYYDQSEDADEPLDIPFLEDVDYVQSIADEDEWDAEGTFDDLVSRSSLAFYGRDYRGYFSVDHDTYQATWVDAAGEAWTEDHVLSAPIDDGAAQRSGLFDVTRLEAGEREYKRLCAGCHGLSGDGSGPASRHLNPRPRNFRRAIFKFTSSNWSSRARREDLFKVITGGLVGSAMPSFRMQPEEKRLDLVEYVRFLAIQGEFEQTMVDYALSDEEFPDPEEVRDAVEVRWADARQEFPAGAEPPADAASIARGKEIFESDTTACSACHGLDGKGDGPTADDYLDMWGYPLAPRDLTTGKLRAGTGSAGLYVLIAHGIKGTPMPGQEQALSSEDLWHLVHFVQDLASRGTED